MYLTWVFINCNRIVHYWQWVFLEYNSEMYVPSFLLSPFSCIIFFSLRRLGYSITVSVSLCQAGHPDLSCLCDNACKRSLTFCCKSMASCAVGRLFVCPYVACICWNGTLTCQTNENYFHFTLCQWKIRKLHKKPDMMIKEFSHFYYNVNCVYEVAFSVK